MEYNLLEDRDVSDLAEVFLWHTGLSGLKMQALKTMVILYGFGDDDWDACVATAAPFLGISLNKLKRLLPHIFDGCEQPEYVAFNETYANGDRLMPPFKGCEAIAYLSKMFLLIVDKNYPDLLRR